MYSDTGRPYVYLPCYSNSSWGHEPYFSDCFEQINQTKKMLLNENPYRNLSIEQVAKVNQQSRIVFVRIVIISFSSLVTYDNIN